MKKCLVPETHTYKRGRCVMRIRTALNVDTEVQAAVADGELSNSEVKDLVKTAAKKAVKSSKYKNVPLDRRACKAVGLRYSSRRGGCYTKCKDKRSMRYDEH